MVTNKLSAFLVVTPRAQSTTQAQQLAQPGKLFGFGQYLTRYLIGPAPWLNSKPQLYQIQCLTRGSIFNKPDTKSLIYSLLRLPMTESSFSWSKSLISLVIIQDLDLLSSISKKYIQFNYFTLWFWKSSNHSKNTQPNQKHQPPLPTLRFFPY